MLKQFLVCLGVLLPVVSVFGSLKLVHLMWEPTMLTMVLSTVLGFGVYAFVFFPFYRWVKELDKEPS